MFLEECKYEDKEKKMPEYVTDELEVLSADDRKDSDYSDEEYFNEESTLQ